MISRGSRFGYNVYNFGSSGWGFWVCLWFMGRFRPIFKLVSSNFLISAMPFLGSSISGCLWLMVWFWGSDLSWFEGVVDDNVELEVVGTGFATGGVEVVILVWAGLGGGMLLVSTLPLLYHMLFSWWKFDILLRLNKKNYI